MCSETLTQDCAMLATDLRRWFALFFCRTFGFADRDHGFRLLPRKLASTGRSSAASDVGEILSHLAGQNNSFAFHLCIVSRLRC
jgi:hypothetical protein